ncbi:sensor histidine kinase [Maridesulfovibrio salexigens]|uniref:histidine kinase n=1 Tax=Maridesulfovibrio salexigens (strain ATCC 14822 / DSM 2638 / NCIMB 8403 / VKM B-1763) TaxID=526222 RepID=C6BSK4_MARSD|nr:HAMP domain-containing sensor histidine kinase [Maridesulfovibrio salexigens]ACS81460.1 histidine kinase [Maridesulfovibrio salexigens DSM 2638]
MKINSLRFKAIVSYSISLVILLGLYGFAQLGTVRVTEDEVLNNILRDEADDYFRRYAEDKNARLPKLRNLLAATDPAQLPPEFKDTLPLLRDGFYETSGPAAISGPDSHNTLVRTYPEGDRRLYLIYNVSHVIDKHSCVLGATSILLLYFVFTAALGIFLVVFIGKIVFRPLDSLTGKIRAYRPDDLNREFSESVRKDEIGLIALNIQNSFKRVRMFIKREKDFTRDVSHELRTPLSVIKGALELIRLSPSSKSSEMQKPLGRIERSVKDMEETIETLLWIAREENKEVSEACFNINEASERVLRSLQPLVELKKINLVVEMSDCASNYAPERAFSIVLNNVLCNAFNFAPGGSVEVLIVGAIVTVKDSGIGISADVMDNISKPYVKGESSNGFGLGLSIVQRLCDRFGWQFSISSRPEGGTIVSIDFSSTEQVA